MTSEERETAIKEFKEWRDSYYNKNKLPATMFIEEAIKALEQEPSGDLISRQADNLCISCTNIGCEFQSGIVRTECAFYMPPHIESDNCGNYVVMQPVNPQEPKYCDRNICVSNEYNGIGCDECEVTKSQEPKTGHWIPTYGNVKCSVCGSVKDSRNVGKATHYCDFCGAKMESEEV